MTNRIRIAVLAGGWSGERAVSLNSGRAVYDALNRERYRVAMYDPREDLPILMRKSTEIDLAFILLHGAFGEDGRLQGMLDVMGIPFVGSGVLASAMAMNKRVAKRVFEGAGLHVADDVILRPHNRLAEEEVMDILGLPVVIKPVSEGSSLGISIAGNREALSTGIQKAFQHDEEVMVEKCIKGTEITCCILGGEELEALPLVEIEPTEGYTFFDYEAKYTPGATREICPAPIPRSIAEAVADAARTAHRVLGCSVWSRTDFIIQGDVPYVLETNTIPGMTETSLFPLSARAAGMTLSSLLDKMISLALEELEESLRPAV